MQPKSVLLNLKLQGRGEGHQGVTPLYIHTLQHTGFFKRVIHKDVHTS